MIKNIILLFIFIFTMNISVLSGQECSIFPLNNIWNTPVDNLPLDPNSNLYINTIGANTGLHPDFGSGTWDGGPIGIPFVFVNGSQPKVNVTFYYPSESDPGPYPIPPDAPIEGGSGSSGDRHVIVIDRDNCILYEIYDAYPLPDGSWSAGSGAIFDLGSHELRPDGWTSADAAGLPIYPGLIRYEEVLNGEIAHAIRFTVPQTRNTYLWPARHFASSLSGIQYPPMGQRFRLKTGFNISGFSSDIQVILIAMKKYGIILADNGSSWFISGAPDERWDNDVLQELKSVKGSDFEAVDVSSLMIDPNSGQAIQNSSEITLISPNGGESWESGSTHNITWDAGGLTNDVKITLWKDGLLVGLVVKNLDSSTGSYNWTVGKYIGGTAASGTGYRIKIREQGGASFTTEDSSDAVFTLTSARVISLTSPNGGNSWESGSSHNITWSSGGLTNNVKLTLWKDDLLVGLVVKNLDPSSGSYSWTVGNYNGGTAASGTGYRIKIREQGGALFTTEDLSDNSFNISQISINFPNGGENWTIGTSKNITWNANSLINNVKLTLWKDGGFVGLIEKNIDPSSGSYSWTVGDHSGGGAAAGSGYRIKIREQGGSLFTTEDLSDNTFNLDN